MLRVGQRPGLTYHRTAADYLSQPRLLTRTTAYGTSEVVASVFLIDMEYRAEGNR